MLQQSSLHLIEIAIEITPSMIVPARVNCAISHYICPGLSISVDCLTLEPWLSSISTLKPSPPLYHFILPIFNYASPFFVRLRSFFAGFCFVFVSLAVVACRAPSMRKLLLIWTPCSVCTLRLATPTALPGCAHFRPTFSSSLSVCVCWPSLGNFNCNFCFLLAQLATPSSLSVFLLFPATFVTFLLKFH